MIRRSPVVALASILLLLQWAFVNAALNDTVPIQGSNSTLSAGNSTTKAGNSTASALKPTTSSKPKAKAVSPDTIENWRLARSFLWCWIAIMGCLVIILLGNFFSKYLRTISCLNNHNQRYFSLPYRRWGLFKKHFLDAPLFRKRHHREFKLSTAMNMGILPNRAQSFFLIGYFIMMITVTCYNIPWHSPKEKVLVALQKRTGILTLFNLFPIFFLSMRNNPFIWWTEVSFDTFNLFHRWIGRMVILEGIAHGTFYIIYKVDKVGWEGFQNTLAHGRFVRHGFIALCTLVAILIQTPSAIRHAFYETFLHIHQALVAFLIWGIFQHMKGYSKQTMLLKGILAIWIIERSFRLIRILYRNVGKGGTSAEVQCLPGGAMRVKVRLARPWTFTPGQHAYIYMPSVGWWMSHPFSVAWSDEDVEETLSEKDSLPKSTSDVLMQTHCNIYFLIRRRTGFTEKLWRKAQKSPDGKFTTHAFLEGPYNKQKLHSYGTVILFAAGIGITHQVPHVRDLVRGYSNGTVATRKVVLVWIIQSPEHLEWIREWMTSILGMPRRREVLRILLFVSRPKNSKEIYSPSSSVQMFPGKPNIQAIVDQEVEQSIGAIGVTVCGVGGVADEVRKACRQWMGRVSIDFEEESFSW